METYPRRMFVRMSDDGLSRAHALAASLDMTLSELVRLLLQSARPETGSTPGSLVVIDRVTALNLNREMRRWGYHYNQAVHALNTIAYYLRLNEADASEALEELTKVGGKLDSMDSGVALLRAEVAEIVEHPLGRT